MKIVGENLYNQHSSFYHISDTATQHESAEWEEVINAFQELDDEMAVITEVTGVIEEYIGGETEGKIFLI